MSNFKSNPLRNMVYLLLFTLLGIVLWSEFEYTYCVVPFIMNRFLLATVRSVTAVAIFGPVLHNSILGTHAPLGPPPMVCSCRTAFVVALLAVFAVVLRSPWVRALLAVNQPFEAARLAAKLHSVRRESRSAV